MADALRVKIRIEGVREHLRELSTLPKEAQNSLRDRTQRLAETLAQRVRASAATDSRQSALMAPTVKAARDRVPVITAGGTRRVGRNRKPAYKILFGSEFGARVLPQFRPHLGNDSYWFFRAVEHEAPRIEREWKAIADDVVRNWRP